MVETYNNKEDDSKRTYDFKLFGVRIEGKYEEPLALRRAVSLGDVPLEKTEHVNQFHADNNNINNGYFSDGALIRSKNSKGRAEINKGVPWSEQEQRLFLEGLKKFGKGNWKAISKYMKSRTPTQVASHAQKHFMRQALEDTRRRRSSVFDLTLDNKPSVSAHRDALKLPSNSLQGSSSYSGLQLQNIHSNSSQVATSTNKVMNQNPNLYMNPAISAPTQVIMGQNPNPFVNPAILAANNYPNYQDTPYMVVILGQPQQMLRSHGSFAAPSIIHHSSGIPPPRGHKFFQHSKSISPSNNN